MWPAWRGEAARTVCEDNSDLVEFDRLKMTDLRHDSDIPGRDPALALERGGARARLSETVFLSGPVLKTHMAGGKDDGDDDGGGGNDTDAGTGIITKTRPKTKKPSLYKVLLLNDDYTPMEFVVYVLEKFFGKGADEATRIMLHVHQKGVGVCGVYTYEVAETKVEQVMKFSRQNEHPLQCTMEKE